MTVERLGLAATVGMVGFFAFAFYESIQFRGIGQWFPLLATAAGLGLAVLSLVLQLAGRQVAASSAFDIGSDADAGGEDRLGGPVVLAWVAGFPLLAALIGVTLAVTAWLPAFLLLAARVGWRLTVPVTAGTLLVITALRLYLGVELPASVLVTG